MTTTANTTALDIRPFTVAIPDADLTDLQRRLAQTRYPAAAPGDDWSYGTPVSYLRETVDHWKDGFDWRAQEARMNAYPHFLTEIDGQTLHFVHVRSEVADATPLLLAHTYPGSFAEFLDMIDPLVDPESYGGSAADAFHVVIPSMPGFGFSTPVVEGGWTAAKVAGVYDRLMSGLGYASYGVHGSDMGANVARELAILDPEGFLGAHVLQLFSFPSGDPAEFEHLEPADYAALEFMQWFQSVGGYNQMNASRPQTIAAALADSPVGQLAYSELFESFGNDTSKVSRDQLLTQVSLYWLTGTIATAVRCYHEERSLEPQVNHGRIGVAVFEHDFQSVRTFAERDNTDIVHWTHHEGGGHFAALEAPLTLAEDVRVFFTRGR